MIPKMIPMIMRIMMMMSICVCLVIVRANGYFSPCVGARLITTSTSILLCPLEGCLRVVDAR